MLASCASLACLGIRLGAQEAALAALLPDLTPGGNVTDVATGFVSSWVGEPGLVSSCLCLPGLRRGMWDW